MRSRTQGMWWGTTVLATARDGSVNVVIQQNVRVLVDPAGHPFCLCLDDD